MKHMYLFSRTFSALCFALLVTGFDTMLRMAGAVVLIFGLSMLFERIVVVNMLKISPGSRARLHFLAACMVISAFFGILALLFPAGSDLPAKLAEIRSGTSFAWFAYITAAGAFVGTSMVAENYSKYRLME